jgi:hypothetical protein
LEPAGKNSRLAKLAPMNRICLGSKFLPSPPLKNSVLGNFFEIFGGDGQCLLYSVEITEILHIKTKGVWGTLFHFLAASNLSVEVSKLSCMTKKKIFFCPFSGEGSKAASGNAGDNRQLEIIFFRCSVIFLLLIIMRRRHI